MKNIQRYSQKEILCELEVLPTLPCFYRTLCLLLFFINFHNRSIKFKFREYGGRQISLHFINPFFNVSNFLPNLLMFCLSRRSVHEVLLIMIVDWNFSHEWPYGTVQLSFPASPVLCSVQADIAVPATSVQGKSND